MPEHDESLITAVMNSLCIQNRRKHHTLLRGVGASICTLVICTGSMVHGASGDLDPSFGVAGKVVTSFGSDRDVGNSVAVQRDGRIVVAGYTSNGSNDDFALACYTRSGALDTTFGGTGKVTTPIGNGDDRGTSVAIQTDGKIIVAGYSSNGAVYEFALVRYTIAGALDTSFGVGGKVVTPIGNREDVCRGVAIQSDGKIIAVGHSWNNTNSDFALARYTSSGSLDTSFNGTGKVTTPLLVLEEATCVVLQSDGKIVVAGYSTNNGANYDFGVVRYTNAGALDTTFNGTGKVTTPIGNFHDMAASAALQSDGKIVVVGITSTNGSNYDFGVVRYTNTGALDTTFNGTGKVITPIGNSTDDATSVSVQNDGKIVVAGYSNNATNADLAVVRYDASGALDTTFHGTGKVTTPVGTGTDHGNGLVLQSDGKIVIAGSTSPGTSSDSNSDFALARYSVADAIGNLLWPAYNGYAHPLSKNSLRIRSAPIGQFLSPEYEPVEHRWTPKSGHG